MWAKPYLLHVLLVICNRAIQISPAGFLLGHVNGDCVCFSWYLTSMQCWWLEKQSAESDMISLSLKRGLISRSISCLLDCEPLRFRFMSLLAWILWLQASAMNSGYKWKEEEKWVEEQEGTNREDKTDGRKSRFATIGNQETLEGFRDGTYSRTVPSLLPATNIGMKGPVQTNFWSGHSSPQSLITPGESVQLATFRSHVDTLRTAGWRKGRPSV